METCVTRSYKHMYVSYLVNGCVMVHIIVAFLTSEQVQQQSEIMDDQQSELEDLKLKFQEYTFWLWVQRVVLLFSEHIMEWSDLSFFCFLFLGCLWSEVMLAELCMNMMVFGQVISDCNKYFVKWPAVCFEICCSEVISAQIK